MAFNPLVLHLKFVVLTSQPLWAVRVLFSPMVFGWVAGRLGGGLVRWAAGKSLWAVSWKP